ncbi:MAG: flagellin [Oscillospiraceae bacterium]|nr:flagellin [Oscillospiraceae bacterium]
MRVTNNITTRQFLRNNRRALTSMLQSHNRIMTQRRFNRVSEDSINGSKAMSIRRQLRDLDIYADNLSSSKAVFASAESDLYSIAHDSYIKLEEKLVAATNGTYEQMELNIFAVDLENIAEHMVETLNGDFSERQLFGGTSNDPTPFRIEQAVVKNGAGEVVYPPDYNKYYNADGTLKDGVNKTDIPKSVIYNGIPINFDVTSDVILPDGTISKLESGDYTVSFLNNDGTWEDKTFEIDTAKAIAENNNALAFPGSKPIYVDIGLGIKYNENYEVDPQTALDVSMNGAEITNSGIDMSDVKKVPKMEQVFDPVTGAPVLDTEGNPTYREVKDAEGNTVYEAAKDEKGNVKLDNLFSKNLVQLVLDSAAALRDGSQDIANAIIDRANEANNYILTQITTLGTKQNSIEFYLNKNEDYKFNLKERQNVVEGTDMEDEITQYEAIQAAYDASLKLGSNILPHSIFDFI